MTTHCPKQRRRAWILRGFAAVVVSLGALSLLSAWTAEFSSAAYERGSDGDLRRVAGGRGTPLGLVISHVRSDFDTTEIWTNNSNADRPFSRSSISIVDISGTDVSRRLAHALMDDLRRQSYVDWVDVRIVGETLDVQRIGELIVVIEEIRAECSWLIHWNTHHRVHMGSVPEYGTGISLTENGARFGFWDVKAKQQYFGPPMRSAGAIANGIARSMGLVKSLDGAAKKLATASRVPPVLLPEEFEGPSENAVSTAMGLTEPPVLRGLRAGVQGEALWRYEGADAVVRLHGAVDELERQGWTRQPGTSRSPDAQFQRAAATRGTESVEWIYENGRTSLLQDRWSSSRKQADGSWGEPVHHVRGPELPPVVWVHYRNGMSPEQLRSAWASAQADGEETSAAFVSNLSRAQRGVLGIPELAGAQ
ncbi:MAG: hypothetical protein GC161_15095 [Planctomycetaceae bacterium]|nr:hypothetical protein [Planctomycetaceae bacterium]